MNEFENNPQEKTNDVPHAATGFILSFVFFFFIYLIGAVISVLN